MVCWQGKEEVTAHPAYMWPAGAQGGPGSLNTPCMRQIGHAVEHMNEAFTHK